MSPEQFAYWLHGFQELTQGQTPNPAQWKSICEHLDLVFKKVTPPVGEKTKAIIKIDVDTKDAQKSIDDLKKAYEDLARKAKEASPWPPVWNQNQPYCLQPNMGFPPATMICSTGQMSVADTSSPSLC